jgi:hypothetical protein
MRITKSQLKQIVKEELSALEEVSDRYAVSQIEELLQSASPDGKLIIQLDGAGEPLEVFEAYEADGNVYLSVERRR